MHAFDPEKERARLLGDDLGLDWELAGATKMAAEPKINVYSWRHTLDAVGKASLLGLADDPRCQELLRLVLEVLGRWATLPAAATSQHDLAEPWMALAIARWILTNEPQPELLARAHDAYRRSFAFHYGKKKKWTAPALDHWVGLACAAGRFPEVLAFFQQPQLASYASAEVSRVRTITDLGLFIARQRVGGEIMQEPRAEGAITQAQLVLAGQRMLRHQVVGRLELSGITEIGFQLYLVHVVIGGLGALPAREALLSIPDHVSYLVKARASSARAARPAPPTRVAALSPINPAPLPAIVHGTTGPEALTEVWDKKPRWTRIDTPQGPRWAVRHGSSLLPRERDSRIPLLHEISQGHLGTEVVSGLRHLARATLDGRVLSELALLPTLCPIEVSFPWVVDNWFDGMVQVSPPMQSRKEWKAALAVGSLTRLRALSFDAREKDKARVARGTKPYLIGPEWFWQSPLAQQLEALDVSANVHDLAQWIPRFASSPRLSRVLIRMWVPVEGTNQTSCLRLVLTRDGERRRIVAQCAYSLHFLTGTITALFAGSSPDQFTSLDFDLLRNQSLDEAEISTVLSPHVAVGELRSGASLIEL
jgi:hypothetical protein